MRTRLFRRLGLAAAALTMALSVTAVSAPPAAAAPAPYGKVTVGDRTFITDSNGRALHFRGFNRGKYPSDRVSEQDVQEMAAKGLNFLRLVVQWQYIEPVQGRYDADYLAYIDRVLSYGDRHGVYVMIDMHQDVFGPHFGGHNGMPAWATRDDGLPYERDPDGNWFNEYFQPGVQAAFEHLYEDADLRAAQVAMWQQVARTASGHQSLLGYDLMNEPMTKILENEDLVTASARFEQGQLAAMYRRLITGIRQIDTRGWIFVEPTVLVGEGVPTRLPAFNDDRVAYAPHFYNTGVEVGADWDPADGFVERYEAAITAYPKAHRMPLIVGEWGPPSARTPGNRELIRRQMAAINRFASGEAMWYWCKGNGGYCALDPQGAPAPGHEPAFGPYARAVAGRPTAHNYDPATRTFTLSYTLPLTVHGDTEISLPDHVYPNGFNVSVAGIAGRLWDDTRNILQINGWGAPYTTVKVTITPR
ncbi:cellulase family glycosylhydrolase [Thermomonospora umbrina]|uniref:Endoglycosylceramidase n=1 Tax=Thermomonospora umbrina TaxID=111806 RepID=A0A3D9SMG4_9ACTN|nr:cellulase family glycosylhydrolase [Thermomonospora umbrina]REE97038.1 endoglycosylceramidase [Thermomonospora umbrina]